MFFSNRWGLLECLHVVLEIPILLRGKGYNLVFLCIMYSLVILICFISTDKELHIVDQQTQVDKKQQQFGSDEASILCCI